MCQSYPYWYGWVHPSLQPWLLMSMCNDSNLPVCVSRGHWHTFLCLKHCSWMNYHTPPEWKIKNFPKGTFIKDFRQLWAILDIPTYYWWVRAELEVPQLGLTRLGTFIARACSSWKIPARTHLYNISYIIQTVVPTLAHSKNISKNSTFHGVPNANVCSVA